VSSNLTPSAKSVKRTELNMVSLELRSFWGRTMKAENHKMRVPVIVCLIGFCISVAINYPGFLSYDSVEQLLEARNGVYSDWHPPLLALIWHFVDKLVPGSPGVLIFQSALLWSGTLLVTLFWFNLRRTSIFWLVLPSALLYFPPIFGISGAIWKDIVMLGFMILAIGAMGSLSRSSENSWLKAATLLFVGVMLLLSIMVRHNAVFAAVPLMTLCIIRIVGGRGLHTVVAGCIALTLCFFFVMASLYVDKILSSYHRNSWVSLAIFDIAGVTRNISDRSQQEAYYSSIPLRLREQGTLDGLLAGYHPAFWETLFEGSQPAFVCPTGKESPATHPVALSRFDTCFEITDEEAATLKQLWLNAIVHHPVAWFRHRKAVFGYTSGANHRGLFWPVYLQQANGNSLPKQILAAFYGPHIPTLNKPQRYLKWFLDRLSRTWLYQPWVYIILSISVMALTFLWRGENGFEVSMIAASGLTHQIGLFLLAPSVDYRYSQYTIYVSVLSFTFLLYGRLKEFTFHSVPTKPAKGTPFTGKREIPIVNV
jgi:hypothetical protein